MSLSVILILNAIILVTAFTIAGFIGKPSETTEKKYQVFFGFLFGIVAILVLSLPWGLETGVFYDSRTILYAIVALFYSPVVTIISAIIGSSYRWYQGGAGAIAGIITIFGTSIIGIITQRYILKKVKRINHWHLYIYGLVIHMFMLLYHFTLPTGLDFIFERIRLISPIVLTVYPLVVVVGSLITQSNNKKVHNASKLKEMEKRYRSIFESAQNGIIQYDMYGVIQDVNERAIEILGSATSKVVGLNISVLPNKQVVEETNKSLHGEIGSYLGWYTSFTGNKTRYIDAKFIPLVPDNVQIGGVIAIADLTDKINAYKRMEKMVNTDESTGLFNRRYYEECLRLNTFCETTPVQLGAIHLNNWRFYLDTLGYDTFEEIAKKISKIIKKHVDNYDDLFRITLNDFVIVVHPEDKYSLDSQLEKIRKDVNKLIYSETSLTVTFTSVYSEDKDANAQDLSTRLRNKVDSIFKFSDTSINMNSINVLLASLFEKSPREKEHSERVSELAYSVGKHLNLDRVRLNNLRTAAILHDIGKINIPSTVLEKPGSLTPEEYQNIKDHSMIGYRILSSVVEYEDVARIVLSHHEKVNGGGYPIGIKKDDIPLESRIITVCDAYDAMINRRPYKPPMSNEEAIQELIKYKKTQFDDNIVDVFIEVINSK